MMNKNSKRMYEVKPDYFHLDSGVILFLDGKSLTDFLNYSEYKAEVMTYDDNKENGYKE